MEKTRKILPYLFIVIFAFYVLPLLIQDTSSGLLILLIGIPAICFMGSFMYGMKNSFNWLFPLLVILMFVPTIFIFYNERASIYVLVYGIISLIGNFIGSKLYKKDL